MWSYYSWMDGISRVPISFWWNILGRMLGCLLWFSSHIKFISKGNNLHAIDFFYCIFITLPSILIFNVIIITAITICIAQWHSGAISAVCMSLLNIVYLFWSSRTWLSMYSKSYTNADVHLKCNYVNHCIVYQFQSITICIPSIV